jgi:hypothetical protein
MISPREWTIGASEFYSVTIHCFSLPVLRFVSMAVMRSDDISDVIMLNRPGNSIYKRPKRKVRENRPLAPTKSLVHPIDYRDFLQLIAPRHPGLGIRLTDSIDLLVGPI